MLSARHDHSARTAAFEFLKVHMAKMFSSCWIVQPEVFGFRADARTLHPLLPARLQPIDMPSSVVS